MSLFEAILLGIIQGLTEFLPVSSTAHLTLAGKLLHLVSIDSSASWTAYIAVLQLGTLAAVILYFSKDIASILHSLLADLRNHGLPGFSQYSSISRLGISVAIGTVPVVLAGILLKDAIHGMFTKSTIVMIASLVVLAFLLWLADRFARHNRNIDTLRITDAVIIGCAQALALIPGSSRSGTTLTAGLFLGLTRSDAARFSFLLSIPAVLASGVYEMTQIDPSVFEFGIANLVLGTLCSAITGYAAISWLLRYLSSNSTQLFVWYRFFLGAALAALLLTGMIDP